MASLYILIPVVLVLVGIAAALFLWAVNNHQFDDLDVEGQRVLFSRDDEEIPSTRETHSADGARPASIESDGEHP